jgi:hypothetical protein
LLSMIEDVRADLFRRDIVDHDEVVLSPVLED